MCSILIEALLAFALHGVDKKGCFIVMVIVNAILFLPSCNRNVFVLVYCLLLSSKTSIFVTDEDVEKGRVAPFLTAFAFSSLLSLLCLLRLLFKLRSKNLFILLAAAQSYPRALVFALFLIVRLLSLGWEHKKAKLYTGRTKPNEGWNIKLQEINTQPPSPWLLG